MRTWTFRVYQELVISSRPQIYGKQQLERELRAHFIRAISSCRTNRYIVGVSRPRMLQISAGMNANMSFDSVWADVKHIYRVRLDKRPWYATCLTEADVQRWSAQMGAPRAVLYDEIAMRLALL